jgi:hypothetical protein
MDGGLEGVVAAEIVLSRSDGGRGILRVRGRTLAVAADIGPVPATALQSERGA